MYSIHFSFNKEHLSIIYINKNNAFALNSLPFKNNNTIVY